VRVELPGLLPLARRLLVRLKRVLPFALAFLLLLLVTPAVFAQGGGGDNAAGAAGAFGCCGVIVLILLVAAAIPMVCAWQIFAKAGKPGWSALVPIYNIVVLLEIIEKPEWLIFMLIPCVNLIWWRLSQVELARKFGKSDTFALGLIFLPIVFYPMLAFGNAQYQGRGAAPRDV
jgi:hypothetical protein